MTTPTMERSLGKTATTPRRTLDLKHTRRFAEQVFGEGLHALRGAVAGQRCGGRTQCGSLIDSRNRTGVCAGGEDHGQERDQAGRSDVEQWRHRSGCPSANVGPVRRRRQQRDRDRARLDGLRTGRSHDALCVPGDNARTSDAAGMEDSTEVEAQGPPHGLGARDDPAAARLDSGHRPGNASGRPCLRQSGALRPVWRSWAGTS